LAEVEGVQSRIPTLDASDLVDVGSVHGLAVAEGEKGSAMTTALKAVWFAAGLALCVLTLQTSFALIQWQAETKALAFDLHQNAKAALWTQYELRKTLQTVSAETKALRGAIETQTAYALISWNANLGIANETLLKTGYSVAGSAAGIADSVDGVASGAKQVESQVSDAVSLTLDCDHNPDCFHNRWVGASRAAEKSAEVLADSLPRIAEGVAQTAENTAAITKSVRHWDWLKPWKWF
jgi:hypothetical protein